MDLLASFNYTDPPLGTHLAGAFVGAILFIAIGVLGRPVFGFLAGGLGAGAIAWFVLGAGSSRVNESRWLIYEPIFGTVGAILGAIVAWLEKAWRMRAAKSSKRHASRSSCDDLGA
jgi:hypothetical protein